MSKRNGWGYLAALGVIAMTVSGFSGDLRETSDLQVETVILERLRGDTRLDAGRITVTSEQHRVTLGGSVKSLEEKFLAERLADSTIAGAKGIVNLIEVDSPEGREAEIEGNGDSEGRSD